MGKKKNHAGFGFAFLDSGLLSKESSEQSHLELDHISVAVYSLIDEDTTTISLRNIEGVFWTNLRQCSADDPWEVKHDRNIALAISLRNTETIFYAYEAKNKEDDFNRIGYALLSVAAGAKPVREKHKRIQTTEINFRNWLLENDLMDFELY